MIASFSQNDKLTANMDKSGPSPHRYAKAPPVKLATKIQYLKGVGPKLAELFATREIYTVKDLLEYYPRAFEDRRAALSISSLKAEDVVSLKAQVVKVQSIPMGRSQRRIYNILIKDASGSINCKFFRVPYKGYFDRLEPFKEVRVVGKVTLYHGRLEFHHPTLRDIEPDEEITDDITPVYPEIDNLTSFKILKIVRSALEQIEWDPEIFSERFLSQHHLLTKKEALLSLHYPDKNLSAQYTELKSPAHKRIIFEEFFWLEIYLAAKKMGVQKEAGITLAKSKDLVQKLMQSLPFELTGAQKRSFAEIEKDLSGEHPMFRLVQGDVGSGKTLVAFMSALQAIESGYQVCLMAPTEILAEQHFKNAQKVLGPLSVNMGLLTGRTKPAERKELFAQIESGQIHFLIGTHALLEDPVVFKSLALVVIDEQHRFGVEQRAVLRQKGKSPHFLVMTATPIPRTLAMTVYGDLDVSVIDEMPPGRSPIQTRVIFENKRDQALQFMKDQIAKGRQAYFVFPLVEESEKIDYLKNAVQEFEELKKRFPDLKMDLLHGRMKSDEKESVMTKFRRGETQVLVSTTVIEVGVDVANANIMIIENAERFGLSQLHQLRGRVGRGEHKSFCIMIMGKAVSEEARARTQFLESTTDGFKIAEFDLEIRGPGEFLGRRQSGLAGFKIANIVRDAQLLQEARDAAFLLLQQDPELKRTDHQALKVELLKLFGPNAIASIG